jgi:predicted O-methyltransferase YrrM
MNAIEPLLSESLEVHKVHGMAWYKWLHHLIGKPVAGLELGTCVGDSASWFLDHIFTHAESQLWTVDTFTGSDEHRLAGEDTTTWERQARDRLERFGKRAQIFKGDTNYALRYMFRDSAFQFVYVDAAHDAASVLRDGVLAFDLLTPGGIMIFDDYEWKVMDQEVDRPRMAIDAFLGCYARRLEVIGVGLQVAVKKVA